MIVLLILVASFSYGLDHYQFSGDFEHSVVYHYQNMLLIRDVKNLRIVTQPKIPQDSFISDIGASDCILVLKPKTRFVVKEDMQGVSVECYDQIEKQDTFSILLDAGHGGKDPGAISVDGIKEKDVVFKFVKQLEKLLDKRFMGRVQLTRKGDEYLSKYQRLKMVLETKPSLMISIHADAFYTPSASGFGALFLQEGEGASRSQEILASYKASASTSMREQSRVLAQSILDDIGTSYHLHSLKATPEALVILRSPWTPSVLLELGFLSNPIESKKLTNIEYMNSLASDISKSIEAYVLKNYGIIKIGIVD